MAERPPIVDVGGEFQELPAGDTLPASALPSGAGLTGVDKLIRASHIY